MSSYVLSAFGINCSKLSKIQTGDFGGLYQVATKNDREFGFLISRAINSKFLSAKSLVIL